MRETTPRDWHRWRIAPARPAPRAARVAEPVAAAPAEAACAEGIRHELVARVRAEIAAGTYDTEEKWARAEEALLRRIEGRS